MANYIFGTEALKDNKVVQFAPKVVEEQPKEKTGNYKVGEKQEVYPFRATEDLQKMHNYFIEKKMYRDDMMFRLGVNVGLRAGDLLMLTWNQVFPEVMGEITDTITIKEEKTDKFRTFYLNASARSAIMDYYKILVGEYNARIEKYSVKRNACKEGSKMYEKWNNMVEEIQAELDNLANDYLFKSREGGYIEVRPAGLILKKAAKAVGIKYNVGTHSMRKTFGYHQLKAHKDDAEFLCHLQNMFNHSSPQITLRYCGLESEKMHDYYDDVCLL